MIWLTWRQFRAQAWVALAMLAVIAVALAVTGPQLASTYNASGIATCAAHGDCGALVNAFMANLGTGLNNLYDGIRAISFVVPALIGVFWGAPLITRELEAGTLRLVWNQSVTRTHWTLVKVGLVGLVGMAVAGLLSLAVTWWSSPIERAIPQRMTPAVFGVTGIAPVGYAAFAFALGVTTGLLVRRTVPAMAVTLASVCAFQAVMVLWVRARLIPPVRVAVSVSPADIVNWTERVNGSFALMTPSQAAPGAWILSAPAAITTPPHVATQACLQELRQGRGTIPPACMSALAKLHLQEVVSYQPDSRYWTFQGYETAIVLVLAVALVGICYWRIQRSLG
jgi:hypothetical protein